MRHITIMMALSLFWVTGSAETVTERRISSQDIGTLVFTAPAKWKGVESYDDLQAAATYAIESRRPRFSLKISARNAGFETPEQQQEIHDFVIARLESYLEYSMAEYIQISVEGAIIVKRFGKRDLGVYARITDKDPGDEPYVYLTRGARLLGDTVVLFDLYSNDKDESVLATALDVVASVRPVREFANAPDSYLCVGELMAGFGYIDNKWEPINTDKLKNIDREFVVRRSQAGDAFSDSSEWVVATRQQEKATTFCDNDYIAKGMFICRGMEDEEFRMDTRTLRFLYARLPGYHDVQPGAEKSKNSEFPHMEIGTCEAK
ncbi:MAG: hypothetical protein ACE5OQ_01400 [Woeseia sp.]